jgi:hypothetical protein
VVGVGVRIAYVADGRVHLKFGDEPPRSVDSPFIGDVRRREASIVQRSAWKAGGPTSLAAGQFGADVEDPTGSEAFAAITGLSHGRVPGELIYSIQTSAVTGLFALDVATAAEARLFHGNQQRVESPSTRPGLDLVACSLRYDAIQAHIAVMRADGSSLTELTDGDSVDGAPSWTPDGSRRLVYQSAGVGRDAAGRVVATAPSAIHELDVDRGEVRTLAESPTHDCLSPRVGADGTLHYIRRPWVGHSRVRPFRLLLDVLLLPFRLVAAIFNWLDFFTVRYSGRPLITPGGAAQGRMDARQWLIWKNLLGAAHQARHASDADDVQGTTPNTWQLVCQRAGGEAEVVARGVCAFDLTADGIVYSTGSAIHHRTAAGDVRLCSAPRATLVIALP